MHAAAESQSQLSFFCESGHFFFLLWMFAAKLRFRSTVSKAALFCSRTHFEFSFYHHQKKWERKKGEQKRDSGSQRTNERTNSSIAVVKQRDTSTRNGTVFSAAFYWRLSSIIFFIDHCPNNRISNLVTFKGSRIHGTQQIHNLPPSTLQYNKHQTRVKELVK